MNDNLVPACGNCLYSMNGGANIFCRRYPPDNFIIGGAPQFGPGPQTWWQRLLNIPGKPVVIGGIPTFQSQWPELARDRWCGEYKETMPERRPN